MRKKFKRYAGAGMAAALFLTAVPMHPVSGADLTNSESVVESETGIEAEDAGSVADYQEESAAFSTTEEDIAENGQAGTDSEDVTAAFTDPNFLAEVRKALNLGENDPVTKEACETLKTLSVNNKCIDSLAGIEYFTELTELNCSNNWLTSLDVTKCTKLVSLHCSGNQLDELNVGGCTALRSLYCEGNFLTALDVGNCERLEYLTCGYEMQGNQLDTLDVSKCPKLRSLWCNFNFLTELNLENCPELDNLGIVSNYLTELNLENCPKVTWVNCIGNQLTKLELGNCSELTYLACNANQLKELDLSKCIGLEDLSCGSNKLTTLDVSACTSLKELYCSSNNMKSQDDVKGMGSSLTSFTFEPQNEESSENTEPEDVTEFFTDDNFRVAVREVLALDETDPITKTACAEVSVLDVRNRNIKSLDGIQYFTKLTELYCGGNDLTGLNVSRHRLNTLDVSGCADHWYLDGSLNRIAR